MKIFEFADAGEAKFDGGAWKDGWKYFAHAGINFPTFEGVHPHVALGVCLPYLKDAGIVEGLTV